MTLADTGPVVAILNQNDQRHELCRSAMASLSGPLIITDPVITEAMYLLGEAGGWIAQAALWSLEAKGDLEIADQGLDDRRRMSALMQKYYDRPMDLADATLVAYAEEHGHSLAMTRKYEDLFEALWERKQAGAAAASS